jgi:hypothetical protein
VKNLKIIDNIKLNKSSKFLILLLTSILVGTANAAIFYSLTMQPQVTVSTPVIRFDSASDEPLGSTVNGAWCSLTAKSYPNATLTYEKAVYLTNTDTLNSHSFRLRYISITPSNASSDVANWNSTKFLVYDSSGSYVFSLNFTVSGNNWMLAPSSGQTGYYSIPASTTWWIRLETLSPATATEGKVCNIQIVVDVEE